MTEGQLDGYLEDLGISLVPHPNEIFKGILLSRVYNQVLLVEIL